jgi:glycosyltransferase involved in cell wall biosynthesis
VNDVAWRAVPVDIVDEQMQNSTTVVLFDPYIIGHHVHKLNFTLKELRRIPGLMVIPVANKAKTPNCTGYYWNQRKIESPPTVLFLRYIVLMINLLRSAKGGRVLLNNAYDNTWKHFGLLGIFLVPLLRVLKIRFLCLQFRTNYLREIRSLTDLLQRLSYGILHVGLGQRFILLVTQRRHANAPERIEYLPDILDIPEEMPSKKEAREHLGLPQDQRIMLFFGDIEEPRRGFEFISRHFDSISQIWKMLVITPRLGKYEQFVVNNSERIHIITHELSHVEKVNAFRAADVVLLLYPESFAGSSGVMTDAIMYERPVMVTRFRYAEEILFKYEVGIFIDSHSGQSLLKSCSDFTGEIYTEEIARCKKDMIEVFRSQLRKVVLEDSVSRDSKSALPTHPDENRF